MTQSRYRMPAVKLEINLDFTRFAFRLITSVLLCHDYFPGAVNFTIKTEA